MTVGSTVVEWDYWTRGMVPVRIWTRPWTRYHLEHENSMKELLKNQIQENHGPWSFPVITGSCRT